MSRNTAQRPLTSLLAHNVKATELLPHLHQHALDSTGGVCSLLFQHNPRVGTLEATSGCGLDVLRTDPWTAAADEAELVADGFERRKPVLVNDAPRQTPELAARLGTRAALLLPLVRGGERVGLLAIGFHTPPSLAALEQAAVEAADAFITGLELVHFRQNVELLRDVRELLDEFRSSLSATLNLAAGLDIFCYGANRLLGADRTSVWIHDRRARTLVLQASSEPSDIARGVRISTEDSSAPAAVAMRSVRAEIEPPRENVVTALVTVPLKGTRRALGTIVLEGVRVETGGERDLLNRADELGRQLSSAIENMQLLDDVLRSRRELENTFDSITHLVAVADTRGHIVHVNQAFAARVRRNREELLDRPIGQYVGPELSAWLQQHASARAVGNATKVAVTREVVDPVWNGPFTVTVTDLLNHDREPVGSVIVARDLTSQSRLESEREELRKRLTQSEKLAALGQFVAGIAHELNNPLQGVLGHLELMRTSGAFPKKLRREVQTVYREADRAAKIVRNLLVFAGSRRLERRSVNLNVVLQKVLSLRAAAHRAIGIEVVRHYDDKLPRLQSDPLLLHQVFLNMVMNAEQAIEAAGGGGRIEISTAVPAARDRIVVTVRDTGTGIPAETLPGSSSRSTRRKRSGRARGSVSRSPTGSCRSTAGRSSRPTTRTAVRCSPSSSRSRRHQDANA